MVEPTPGEVITAAGTKNTYTMGPKIGEGHFGVVYSCQDAWGNDLAAKVFKALGTYEKVRAAAEAEFHRLLTLRNPFITFVYDAFEYRDTLYIITERCAQSIDGLFKMEWFAGPAWLMPIARCLLQAVHYLHTNNYVHQDIHPGNVFMAFARDEMESPNRSITFKLGDLGVAGLVHELNPADTRAEWMLPPEILEPATFGPIDHRLDLYHVGLLFLQLALSKEMRFSREEILAGKPRELGLGLPAPYSFALEKALRRRVAFRTEGAMELWRDLRTPAAAPSSALEGAPDTQEEDHGQTR